MNNGLTPPEDMNGIRKAYKVNLQLKARSSSGCSFCWFVLNAYPSFEGMTSRDSVTYRAHLEKSHGLKGEISQ